MEVRWKSRETIKNKVNQAKKQRLAFLVIIKVGILIKVKVYKTSI